MQAHDVFTAALRIQAGRKQTPETGVDCTDRSRGEEVNDEKGKAAAGGGGEDLEEHDVQASFRRGCVALQ